MRTNIGLPKEPKDPKRLQANVDKISVLQDKTGDLINELVADDEINLQLIQDAADELRKGFTLLKAANLIAACK